MISKEQKEEAIRKNIADLLPPESDPRQTGSNQWKAHCPFHDPDKRPSLVIWRFDDDTQRYKCYACGAHGTGINLVMDMDKVPYPVAVERILGLQPREGAEPVGTEVARYYYKDQDGTTQYCVVRYEPKTFRPMHEVEGKWKMGYGSETRYLYHADKLAAMPEGAFVLLVEGEKDADAAIEATWDATTWAGGADSWRDHLASQLEGLTVIAIPDNDLPGFRAMRAASLAVIPKAKRFGYVVLPNGKDLSDFLAAGGNIKQLIDSSCVWDKPVSIPAELVAQEKERQEAKKNKKQDQPAQETPAEVSNEVPM